MVICRGARPCALTATNLHKTQYPTDLLAVEHVIISSPWGKGKGPMPAAFAVVSFQKHDLRGMIFVMEIMPFS
jgi:hypothetical protein